MKFFFFSLKEFVPKEYLKNKETLKKVKEVCSFFIYLKRYVHCVFLFAI